MTNYISKRVEMETNLTMRAIDRSFKVIIALMIVASVWIGLLGYFALTGQLVMRAGMVIVPFFLPFIW